MISFYPRGAIAQLGERIVRNDKAAGPILVGCSILK